MMTKYGNRLLMQSSPSKKWRWAGGVLGTYQLRKASNVQEEATTHGRNRSAFSVIRLNGQRCVMETRNGEKISNDVTAATKGLLKIVVMLLFITAVAALPAYAQTGESEKSTASGYSEESLITSGFKPFRALASEPDHISDRVKLLHGSSYFILSNLNNFTYKPFHGQNMWIGEFTIINRGGRVEVVFNIGNDRVIAVAGYRFITDSAPTAVAPTPPPVYQPSPPQTVYIPEPQPPVVYEPVPIYPQIGIYAFPQVIIPLFPVRHHHPFWSHQWGHSYWHPRWGWGGHGHR